MTTDQEHRELRALSTFECWELVRSRGIGRFAANRPGRSPLVVPVNYVVEADHSVVLRSGVGTKLESTRNGVIGIQVDDVDPMHRIGWSVLIEGNAHWVYAEQDHISIETWAPGDRPYVIRVSPTRVTGRRIRLRQPDTDGRGYR